ncbi:DUF4832 domain-containing protein [Aliivibrio salmonicida]|uniref:DUF4832 domain-containing protein n=1 Tax=Aliivibrio salmonicida TaxID=40269 RepID=UPI003D1230C2
MFFLKYSPLMLSFLLVGCGSDSDDSSSSETITIYPKISNAILVNPDIGFTDFHSISIKDNQWKPVPSYPETSTVYYRWDWSDIQPTDADSFDFTAIQSVVDKATAANKKLALRIVAMENTGYGADASKLPDWLLSKISVVTSPNGPLVPDYTESVFLMAAEKLITELGIKFDDPNVITSIDIGMVGSWGEWNLEDAYPGNGTLGLYAQNEEGLFCDFSQFSKYASMFQTAFTKVPTVMLIGSSNVNETFLAQATNSANPSGWRADCLGDKYGYFSDSWSHMDEGYPEALDNAERNGSQVRGIWKRAPVQFETCDNMTVWQTQHSYTSTDVTDVFDYALDHHASLINAKSHAIPDEYQLAVQEVLKKLGYRFELNSFTHPKEARVGDVIQIHAEWKNTGVAPSYYPYQLAYRFVDSSGTLERQQDTSRNVLDWLPAETRKGTAPVIDIKDDITVPDKAGVYDLQVALINDNGDAKIKLAIDMPQINNWYSISTITVH